LLVLIDGNTFTSLLIRIAVTSSGRSLPATRLDQPPLVAIEIDAQINQPSCGSDKSDEPALKSNRR
jgi:hypothetical protein